MPGDVCSGTNWQSLAAAPLFSWRMLALGADVIAPYHYTTPNFGRNFEFPSRTFFLGTDHLGRDVFSRIIYGARVSMTVGCVAECLVLAIGVPLGALAGYYGGRRDMLLMRFVDVMYAFPRLLFVIMIMSMLGAGSAQYLHRHWPDGMGTRRPVHAGPDVIAQRARVL